MPIFRTGSAASEEFAGNLDSGVPYASLKPAVVSTINSEIAAGTYNPSDWGFVPQADRPSGNPTLYPALKDTSWSGSEWGGFLGGLAKFVEAGTSGAAEIVHGPGGAPAGTPVPVMQGGFTMPKKQFPWPLVVLGAGGLGLVLLMSRGDKKKED